MQNVWIFALLVSVFIPHLKAAEVLEAHRTVTLVGLKEEIPGKLALVFGNQSIQLTDPDKPYVGVHVTHFDLNPSRNLFATNPSLFLYQLAKSAVFGENLDPSLGVQKGQKDKMLYGNSRSASALSLTDLVSSDTLIVPPPAEIESWCSCAFLINASPTGVHQVTVLHKEYDSDSHLFNHRENTEVMRVFFAFYRPLFEFGETVVNLRHTPSDFRYVLSTEPAQLKFEELRSPVSQIMAVGTTIANGNFEPVKQLAKGLVNQTVGDLYEGMTHGDLERMVGGFSESVTLITSISVAPKFLPPGSGSGITYARNLIQKGNSLALELNTIQLPSLAPAFAGASGFGISAVTKLPQQFNHMSQGSRWTDAHGNTPVEGGGDIRLNRNQLKSPSRFWGDFQFNEVKARVLELLKEKINSNSRLLDKYERIEDLLKGALLDSYLMSDCKWVKQGKYYYIETPERYVVRILDTQAQFFSMEMDRAEILAKNQYTLSKESQWVRISYQARNHIFANRFMNQELTRLINRIHRVKDVESTLSHMEQLQRQIAAFGKKVPVDLMKKMEEHRIRLVQQRVNFQLNGAFTISSAEAKGTGPVVVKIQNPFKKNEIYTFTTNDGKTGEALKYVSGNLKPETVRLEDLFAKDFVDVCP